MIGKNRGKGVNLRVRLYAFCGVFIVFCAVFAARLIYYQLAEYDKYASAVVKGNVRTERVLASRGAIRDKNGKILVADKYSQNLIFDYYALPDTRDEVHRVFLNTLEAIEATGSSDGLVASSFPFEGTFPNYTLSDEALDEDSNVYARLWRFAKNNLCRKDESPEEALARHGAYDIAIYIAKKYDMIESGDKENAYTSNFTDGELDALIRLRYDMELSGFGAAANYTVLTDASDELIAYIAERHVRGARFEYTSERDYRYDGYASHILGQVGPIYAEDAEYYTNLGYSLDSLVGKSGCEYAFEEYLHGKDGTIAIVEDDDGNIIGSYYIEEPVPGRDVWLTIDIDVQVAAENALRDNIETRINSWQGGKADAGAVVATDPNTGAIIAIASYPTYSLSSFNEDYADLSALAVSPYLNRALSGAYAPGSTFKVGMALAALSEGLIDSNTRINTKGIYNGLACSHYSASAGEVCCGNIDVEGALMVSCNYFFSYLGDQLGIDNIRAYSEVFGFGSKTGIELGEASGNVAESLSHAAAIGQSDNLCTPLQVSQYISMIANGGKRYAAHLLYAVKDSAGNTLVGEETSVIAELSGIDSKDIDTVRRGMYDVISGSQASSYVTNNFTRVGNEYMIGGTWQTDGAGNEIYVGGVRVAGKTGTAETADSKAGKCADNAWFTGFAPYEDPEIVVTCFIEKGITGGLSSYTVAKTMDAYFNTRSNVQG